MAFEHSDIADPEIHESKGVAAAAANTLAHASGAGSTTWKKLVAAAVDTTSVFGVNTVALTFRFADISTASTQYLVIPFAGTLIKVYTALQTAITTADAGVLFKNAAGTTMTGGSLTVTQSGSAVGDIDTCTPSANNTFVAGTALRVTTDGASDTTADLVITLVFTVTGAYA